MSIIKDKPRKYRHYSQRAGHDGTYADVGSVCHKRAVFVQYPENLRDAPDGPGRKTEQNRLHAMASDSSREYRILVAPQARRQLAKLPKEIRGRIGRRIEELAANPRPRSTIKLEGEEDLYRNRVGEYGVTPRNGQNCTLRGRRKTSCPLREKKPHRKRPVVV